MAQTAIVWDPWVTMEERVGLQEVLGQKPKLDEIDSGLWGRPAGRHKRPLIHQQDWLPQ